MSPGHIICPGGYVLKRFWTRSPGHIQIEYVLEVYVLVTISWRYVLMTHRSYMSWQTSYMSWRVYVLKNRLDKQLYVLAIMGICPGMYMSWWYVLTTKTICPERYILYICPEHFWYMSWVPIVCICPGYMSWPLVPYVLSLYVLGICLEHYCYMSWAPSVCICLGGMSWPQKLYVLNVYILYICLEMYRFMSWEASVRICLGVMSWPLWLYVLSVYILDICPERYGYMSWVVSDRICLGSMSWTVCPESIRPGNMSWVHVLINNKLMYILCFIVYDNQMSTPLLFYCLW